MSREDEQNEPLTAAGATRRREILADALRGADRRRQARIARRAGAVAGVASVFIGLVLFATRDHDGPASIVPVVVERPHLSNPPSAPPTQVVQQDGRILKSIAPPPQTRPAPEIVVQVIAAKDVQPKWQTLTDEQFLAELADAGRPSGLVRINGREFIVPVHP